VHVARAKRYLLDHATEPIQLAQVARAAGASPYHFSRLYHAFTGETVATTVTRLRVSRGAALLCAAPRRSISQIALEVGYATPSAFNKAFRAVLGMTPTALRALPTTARRLSLAALDEAIASPATWRPPAPPPALPPPSRRARGPERVIYVRERGNYGEIAAPLAWARLEACLAASAAYDRFLRVAASHDDPRTVGERALRYDAGIVVEAATPVPPGASVATWPGGVYAVFEHRGPFVQIAPAFHAIFRDWVATGRLPLRDAPSLEIYRVHAARTPEHELLTELWMPVPSSP
jgi:AraC family transcriptional regulator